MSPTWHHLKWCNIIKVKTTRDQIDRLLLSFQTSKRWATENYLAYAVIIAHWLGLGDAVIFSVVQVCAVIASLFIPKIFLKLKFCLDKSRWGLGTCHFVSYVMSLRTLTSQCSVTLTTADASDFSSWSANCCSYLWCLVPRREKKRDFQVHWKAFPSRLCWKGMLIPTLILRMDWWSQEMSYLAPPDYVN